MIRRTRFRPIYIVVLAVIVVSVIFFISSTRTKFPTIEEINSEKELFETNYERPSCTAEGIQNIKPPRFTSKLSSIKWFTPDLEQKLLSVTMDHCPLCKMDGYYKSNSSTPRDFIVTAGFNCTNNIQSFLRSLRSTGCKATVVIFVDDLGFEKLHEFQQMLIFNCGAVLINVGAINKRYYDKYGSRHLFFFKFIYEYKHLIDRVIFADLFDIFYQEDPFTDDFNSTGAFASTEFNKFKDCPQNTKWVKSVDKNYAQDFYADKTALCFGLYYGSINCMLKFYDIIFKQPDWSIFKLKDIDQGYLNYYFYKGIFSSNGLHLRGTRLGDKIVTTRGGQASDHLGPNGEVLLKGSDVVPSVLHNYNRQCKFLQAIQEKCPAMAYDKRAYAVPKEMTEECPDISEKK